MEWKTAELVGLGQHAFRFQRLQPNPAAVLTLRKWGSIKTHLWEARQRLRAEIGTVQLLLEMRAFCF